MTSHSSRMTIQVSKRTPNVNRVSSFANRGRVAGGKKILQRVAGKDASKQFWKYHNEGILKKYKPKLLLGSLDSKPKTEAAPAPAPAPKPAPKKETPAAAPTEAEQSEALEPYGQQIPFGDPAWYQSVSATPTVCHVLGSRTRLRGVSRKSQIR